MKVLAATFAIVAALLFAGSSLAEPNPNLRPELIRIERWGDGTITIRMGVVNDQGAPSSSVTTVTVEGFFNGVSLGRVSGRFPTAYGGREPFGFSVQGAGWFVFRVDPDNRVDEEVEDDNNDSLRIDVVAGIDGPSFPSNAPLSYELAQNYPNPFNPATTIRFDLPQAGQVHLAIYDLSGREVKVLVSGWRRAGQHEVAFDATGLPSGMYFYRLQAGGFAIIRRMVMAK